MTSKVISLLVSSCKVTKYFFMGKLFQNPMHPIYFEPMTSTPPNVMEGSTIWARAYCLHPSPIYLSPHCIGSENEGHMQTFCIKPNGF